MHMFLRAFTTVAILGVSTPLMAQFIVDYNEDVIDPTADHMPTALNERGWVAGVQGVHDGFYWDAITRTPIVSQAGTPLIVEDFNARGEYVAYGPANRAYTPHEGRIQIGGSGQTIPLGVCSAGNVSRFTPFSIDEAGVSAGSLRWCASGYEAVFRDQSGQVIVQGAQSDIHDISPSGQFVVGWQAAPGAATIRYTVPPTNAASLNEPKYAYGSTDPTQAFIYDVITGVFTLLPHPTHRVPAGSVVIASTALGTNDQGDAVGYATIEDTTTGRVDELPIIWSNSGPAYVLNQSNLLPSHGCRATAINSIGSVVGTCYQRVGSDILMSGPAFVRHSGAPGVPTSPGIVQSLNDYVPNSSNLFLAATDINEFGQISVATLADPNAYASGPWGVSLLTPKDKAKGACKVRAMPGAPDCFNMYENQCEGHRGIFTANSSCGTSTPASF